MGANVSVRGLYPREYEGNLMGSQGTVSDTTLKGQKPSNSGRFGYTDIRCRLAGPDRRGRFPHTAFATLCNLACGYQGVEAVRRRPSRRHGCLFDPACHCGEGFVMIRRHGRLERTELTLPNSPNGNQTRRAPY